MSDMAEHDLTISSKDIEDELVKRLASLVLRIEQIDAAGFYFTYRTSFLLWGAENKSTQLWTDLLVREGHLKEARGYVNSRHKQASYFYVNDRDRTEHTKLVPTAGHKERWPLETYAFQRHRIVPFIRAQRIFELVKEAGSRKECISNSQIANLTNMSSDTVKRIAQQLMNDNQIVGSNYRAKNGQKALAYSTSRSYLELSRLPDKPVRKPPEMAKPSIYNLFNTLTYMPNVESR